MLKKRNRLSRNEFATLLRKGRRMHGEYMTVIFLTIPPSPTTYNHIPQSCRCGVVVGKKIAHKAVARNRLRRLVYGVMGERLPSLNNLHVAALLRPQAATQSPEALRIELEGLLTQCTASRAS